jgi:hypothetical protein
MTPHTLHHYRPIAKFRKDLYFIYINTVRRDENQEDLQSHYKLTDEDMDQITKEWPDEFLVPIFDEKLSDTDTIGSCIVTQFKHVGKSNGVKKNKNQEEVQDVETDEEDNASEDNGFVSLGGGGEDEA